MVFQQKKGHSFKMRLSRKGQKSKTWPLLKGNVRPQETNGYWNVLSSPESATQTATRGDVC